MYLGFTAIIRNAYNPYADPTLVLLCVIVVVITKPTHIILRFCADKVGLWKVTGDDRVVVDIGLINRLDKAVRDRDLVTGLRTNPFRYKFLMVNREWIVQNLAMILGGRMYLAQPGVEINYLRYVY